MSPARVVGLLHPGEMGAFVGSAIAAAGHDVLWASAGRSDATRHRAAGFSDAGDLDTLLARLADSDDGGVIVSLCPPSAARDVATAVAARGFRGLYLDANAVSPATIAAIAEALPEATVLDGAVIGGPSSDDAVLHLAGNAAGRAATLFHPDVLTVHVLDGEVGSASALKACYAASSKAVTATLLAARAAAAAVGVEGDLLAEWTRTQPGVAERTDASARRLPRKAWRFVGEMEEAAEFFASVGLPDGFSRSAADTFRRVPKGDGNADPADTLQQIRSAEPS
jgi:3-hydroxyisobutyrate dehydrogenase-like beta-hydroxyacid dehydrogenase